MKQAALDRNRKHSLAGARGLLLLVLAAVALLATAPEASAQFPAESWGADRCDYRSGANSDGPYTVADQFNNIHVAVNGSGTVSGAMYRTGSQECLNPMSATCPPTCTPQPWTVSTVCELHCWHNHSAPYPWWVSLVPTGQGASFVGWTGTTCVPTKDVPRNVCIVFMQTDHAVTAHFRATPDTQAPSAPSASGTATSYTVNLTWSGSSDPDGWFAGYDVYQGTTLLARVGPGTNAYRAENLACQAAYSFRVVAYDWSGNEASSAPVALTTGACTSGGGTKPNTVIHVKPPKTTRSRQAFFHFGSLGTIPATKYQCRLDRGRWVACSGRTGKRYRKLRVGYHTFRVRAGNANGFDATPASYRWRVRR